MKYTIRQTLLIVCSVFVSLHTVCGQSTEIEAKQPNIVWIVCEDISPYVGCFGDELVKTPNIDALAKDGVKFNHAYTVAGVCAPSRCGIITAMYPTSIGGMHMRTKPANKPVHEMGIPDYSAVPPAEVKLFPEYLRMAGYFTTNNSKQDYQLDAPVTVWSEQGPTASHTHCPKDTPFFSIYNLAITHESQLFYPKRTEALRVDPSKIKLPPFYMDTETTRHDMARLFTNIEIMDDQVGEIIKELKEEGLYDDSYIFFYSDHGGALPWMKRSLYERGTHIPLVIKYPGNATKGTENNELVSSIDFGPSVLSLAGVKVPDYMQGEPFMGDQKIKSERKYVYSARDRMGELYDRVRVVRDKKWLYAYNYMPEKPYYQDLAYRRRIPMMKEILEMKEAGKIDNPYLLHWFDTKPVEELYDVEKDPSQLHNLANDPAYKEKLEEMRTAFWTWTVEVGDLGAIPEKEMLKAWWHGKDTPPVTAKPEIEKTSNGYVISCATKGASIGYRILKAGEEDVKPKEPVKSYCFEWLFGAVKEGDLIELEPVWDVYQGETIQLKKGEKLIVNADRIGYQPATSEFTY